MIMNKYKYIQAIKRIGYGYLLTLVNINIGTINIIPDWLGYYFFHTGIQEISQYEKSTELLEPLNIILGVYEFIIWCLKIIGIEIDHYAFTVILSIISLYFHFQLLTNIATIAKTHGSIHAKRIFQLRNANVIFITVMQLLVLLRHNHLVLYILAKTYNSILYVLLLIGLIIGIWICRIMFVYADEEKNLIYEESED